LKAVWEKKIPITEAPYRISDHIKKNIKRTYEKTIKIMKSALRLPEGT